VVTFNVHLFRRKLSVSVVTAACRFRATAASIQRSILT